VPKLIRVSWLAAPAALVAVLVMCGVAQATGSFKGACTFEGDAKASDKDNPSIGVRLSGGAGYFVLPGYLECSGLMKGEPVGVVIKLESRGYYHSIVCGTGMAASTSNTVKEAIGVGPNPKPNSYWHAFVEDLEYAVYFYATKGLLYVKGLGSIGKDLFPAPGTDPKNRSYTDYNLAGTASLDAPPPVAVDEKLGGKPGLPNVAAGECTKAFHVTAAFKIDV